MDSDQVQDRINAVVMALKNLAELEIEQAKQDIKNEQELAAKILEIRDKLEDDIYDVVKSGRTKTRDLIRKVDLDRLESGQETLARLTQSENELY